MILFSDLLDQLESAEASLISLVDKKTGLIEPPKYNQVINLLNAGLSDIFVKFQVREGSCVIQTSEGVYNYVLDKSNALTQDKIKGFILDDESSPFDDEVLEVTEVSSISGRVLPFNTMDRDLQQRDYDRSYSYDVDDCRRSFSSPKYKSLRTPLGLKSCLLTLKYKVGHTKIPKLTSTDLETFDPESLVVDLPYVYLVPLTYYIISRLANARGTERAGQGMFNEGNNFYSKYLAECNQIKETMSQSEQTAENTNTFHQRGFV